VEEGRVLIGGNGTSGKPGGDNTRLIAAKTVKEGSPASAAGERGGPIRKTSRME